MDYSEPFRSSSPFKMGTSMDRLERLFSKKKHTTTAAGGGGVAGRRYSPSAAHRHHSMAAAARQSSSSAFVMDPAAAASIIASSDRHFPQPSFIRPRAARMIPREDTAFYPRSVLPIGSSSSRALSIPDSDNSGELLEEHEGELSSQSPRSASSSSSPNRRGAHGVQRVVPVGSNKVSGGSRRVVVGSHRAFSRRNTTHDAYQWRATSAEPGATRLARSTSTGSSSGASISNFPRVPARSSSLRDRRDASQTSLASVQVVPQLHYSTSTSFSSGEVSPTTTARTATTTTTTTGSMESQKAGAPQLRLDLDELQDLQPLFLQVRMETPPPSDHETSKGHHRHHLGRHHLGYHHQKVLPPPLPLLPSATIVPQSQTRTQTQPATPEASPKMAGKALALPPSPATRRKMRSSLRRPISVRYTESASAFASSSPSSSSSTEHQQQQPVPPVAASTPVLREPNLGDFLSLSDDDIAETAAAAGVVAGVAADKASHRASPAQKRLTAQRVLPVTPPLQQDEPARPASASSVSSVSPPVSPTSTSSSHRRTTALLRRSDAAPSPPPACQAPSPPPVSASSTATPTSSSSTSSSVMQASLAAALARPQTLAGQARMAAAFEIARIASHYDFDLAYIATIWPKNMAILHSAASSTAATANANASTASLASTSSSASLASPPSPTQRARSVNRTSVRNSRYSSHQGSPAPMSPNRAGLEAQFLAAYGLATVQAPYSLSAPTHAKILNNTASRWLEFHNHELDDKEKHQQPGDFATGYGCAFYPGHAPVIATTSMTKLRHHQHHQQQQRKMSSSSTSTSEMDFCDADTELDDLDEEVIVEEESAMMTTSSAKNGRTTPRPVSSAPRHHLHNNRGIVFVAYRRQEADPAQTRVDLDALYRDVEALVDKILDVHMKQQRQSQLELARQQHHQHQQQRHSHHYYQHHHHHHQSSSAATIVPERALLADEDEDCVVPRSPTSMSSASSASASSASGTRRQRSSSLASHHGTHLRMSRNMGVKVY